MATNEVDRFDSIVISEILEHIEQPSEALMSLRDVLSPCGRIYINVPVNSPAIDHIYLLHNPEEVLAMVEGAGLEILDTCIAPASGYSEAKARRVESAISCGIIARRQ